MFSIFFAEDKAYLMHKVLPIEKKQGNPKLLSPEDIKHLEKIESTRSRCNCCIHRHSLS